MAALVTLAAVAVAVVVPSSAPADELGRPATYGAIESIAANGEVRGWAYDPSTPGVFPEIDLYYGGFVAQSGIWRDTAAGSGPYGFVAWLSYGLDGTPQTLRLSVGRSIEWVSSVDYQVLNRPALGYLDSRYGGWAFDPDSAATPVALQASVSCPTSTNPNTFVTEAQWPVQTGTPRPDVPLAHPEHPSSGYAGFSLTIPDEQRFTGRGCRVGVKSVDGQGNPWADGYLPYAGDARRIDAPLD